MPNSNEGRKFTLTINPLLLAGLRASRLEKYKEALPPKTKALLEDGNASTYEMLRTLAQEARADPTLAAELPPALTTMLQAWKLEQKIEG